MAHPETGTPQPCTHGMSSFQQVMGLLNVPPLDQERLVGCNTGELWGVPQHHQEKEELRGWSLLGSCLGMSPFLVPALGFSPPAAVQEKGSKDSEYLSISPCLNHRLSEKQITT